MIMYLVPANATYINNMSSYLDKLNQLTLKSHEPDPTDSCPPGRKDLVICAHTFGDFPHDSWGTVLPSVLLIGSCVFFYTSVICLSSWLLLWLLVVVAAVVSQLKTWS